MSGQSSLYIHIPFCISKCAYCDFFSKPKVNNNNSKAGSFIPDSYVSSLCNEIEFRIKQYQIILLKTIYIGGGTPSLLSKNQFNQIFNTIKCATKLTSQCEITVEVNPDDVTKDLLDSLSECGVNRISCGIQSMNDSALKKACRRANAFINRNALKLLSQNWKGDVSVDLISGLPGDDEKTLLASLSEVCDINPSHISLYSLTIEDETPFGKMLDSGSLKYDFDKAERLWLFGRDFLESHGYNWYEVSNFCRPGKECLHNLTYWTHSDYLGCGSGATGTVYAKNGEGFRWINSQNIESYIDFWGSKEFDKIQKKDFQLIQNEEKIDLETSEFEFFMMGLRKLRGFYTSEYEKVFKKPLPEKFIRVFSEWEKKGLCEKNPVQNKADDVQYRLNREGVLFLNRFLEELC